MRQNLESARPVEPSERAPDGRTDLDAEVVLTHKDRDSAWDLLWRRVFSDMAVADLVARAQGSQDASEAS